MHLMKDRLHTVRAVVFVVFSTNNKRTFCHIRAGCSQSNPNNNGLRISQSASSWRRGKGHKMSKRGFRDGLRGDSDCKGSLVPCIPWNTCCGYDRNNSVPVPHLPSTWTNILISRFLHERKTSTRRSCHQNLVACGSVNPTFPGREGGGPDGWSAGFRG